ncbi:MAG: hypothetical protein RBU37_05980 [Myxococcota bacterium]|jgi:DNA-binding response OmpR family regulator|nr:hypothetical protein [Myxococcota bacterium]
MPGEADKTVLVLCPSQQLWQPLAKQMQGEVAWRAALDARELLILLRRDGARLVLVDLSAVQRPDDLVSAVRRIDPQVPLLLLIDSARAELVVDLLAGGADDFLLHPVSSDELLWRVRARLDRARTLRDESLLAELLAFLELGMRQLVSAEHDLLKLRERYAEISGVSDAGAGRYRLLLVQSDPRLPEALSALLDEQSLQLEACFTGGNALDLVAKADFDGVICFAELPDLDGRMLASSLKNELPHIDAIEVLDWGGIDGRALWVDDFGLDTQAPRAARSAVELAAVIEQLISRRAKRTLGRRLAAVLKQKRRDYLDAYSSLRARLKRALDS